MDQKVVIITGGGRGIGRATAQAFAEEGFNVVITSRTESQLKETEDTETGWGRYFVESGLFKIETVQADDEYLRRPEVRLTLDYPEDLEFTKQVFERLYTPGKVFGIREILSLLDRCPEVRKINQGLQEVYRAEFRRKAAPIRLRKV